MALSIAALSTPPVASGHRTAAISSFNQDMSQVSQTSQGSRNTGDCLLKFKPNITSKTTITSHLHINCTIIQGKAVI